MDGPASRWKFVFGTMFLGASRWPPQIVIRYPTTANMGVAIFPVVEDGTGGWTDRINGKCLAKAVDVFDKVAKRRKFPKLFSFYSWSREDAIIEQLGGDPEDPSTFDESEIPAGRWFSPAEGLITVRCLAHVHAVGRQRHRKSDMRSRRS